METNKLLTLEEIEKIENSAKENLDQWQETTMHLSKVLALLATARAYWEEKDKNAVAFCNICGNKATYKNGLTHCCGNKIERNP